MANEVWRQFEKRVLTETRALGQVITRVPSSLDRAAGGRTFRAKTDCDFAASINGYGVFLDAKACGETRLNLEKILRDKSVHQYNFLLDAHEKGTKAGYLIWLYEKTSFLWLPVDKVKECGKSVGLDSPVSQQPDDRPINLKQLIWGM